ncbi:hypothetical protein ACFRFL_31625 [Streptomyces sp. NPDC056708]|uniref:hypothetical protein n=1 Tax=unclassified Streptomyces TaxID=2593676 RepID=UPI0036797040
MEPKDTIPDGQAGPLAAEEIPAGAVEPSLAGETPEPVPEAVLEAGPEPEPQPQPVPESAPVAEPGAAPVAAPVAKRPRGRTALLIAAAAVLGIAGGTAVGYDVQAGRAPTPLPALSQPDLAYPAKALPAGKAPDPLPASEDRRVKTGGDLRKLLADRPAGWSDDKQALGLSDGWVAVDEYARTFKDKGPMYEYFLESDIRRIAGANWKRGQYRTAETNLVQFGSGTVQGAQDFAQGQLSYMSGTEIGAGNNGDAIKGSGNGRYYVYEVDRKPGYLPSYHARATVYRGDIVADIHIYDTVPISKKDIRTLAERQLERL